MHKILVIDDDRYFAEDAADELNLQDLSAEWAASYTEALAKLQSAKYDLVVLDVMMRIDPREQIDREAANHGRSTGLLLYKDVRRISPATKILILSVLAANDKGLADIRAAVEPGTTILSKPISVGDYVGAVAKALGE